ncbi:hypothetical protein NMY22_g8870 [Coprinellus aureogranulatus]|nr:hypothetical protein NMY22_g8870 [Coprinellus aureogranulatus]
MRNVNWVWSMMPSRLPIASTEGVEQCLGKKKEAKGSRKIQEELQVICPFLGCETQTIGILIGTDGAEEYTEDTLMYPSAILTAGFVPALNSDSRLMAVFWWPASSSCSTTIDALEAGLAETSNSRRGLRGSRDAAASRSGSFPPPFRRIVPVSGIFSSSSLDSSPYRPSPFYLASKLTLSIPSRMPQLPIAPQTPKYDYNGSSTPAPPPIGLNGLLPFPFSTRIPDAIPHLITPLTDTPLDIREWDAVSIDSTLRSIPSPPSTRRRLTGQGLPLASRHTSPANTNRLHRSASSSMMIAPRLSDRTPKP